MQGASGVDPYSDQALKGYGGLLQAFKSNGGIVSGKINWGKGVYTPRCNPDTHVFYGLTHISGEFVKAAVLNSSVSGTDMITWEERVWVSCSPQGARVLTS